MSAQNTPKFSKKAFRAQIFRRLRRAIRGFAYRTVPDSPESATLAVTIIPVSLGSGVSIPGAVHHKSKHSVTSRIFV